MMSDKRYQKMEASREEISNIQQELLKIEESREEISRVQERNATTEAS